MSDRIKVNFAQMSNTINEINNAINLLNEESTKIAEIKRKMQQNWTGMEAEKAYEAIGVPMVSGNGDSILANIASMIDIQKEARDLLQQKYSGFEEVHF